MKNKSNYEESDDFVMEGSVIVAWKELQNKREFVGLYFADADDSKEEMLEENKLPENPIKHNVLIPSFLLENLSAEEKVKLTIKKLSNDIWDWVSQAELEEAARDLY